MKIMKNVQKRLQMETLEDRKLMAVNVLVSAGDLIINGDGASDQVQLSKLTNGAVRIQGLNGTAVNGFSYVDRFFSDDLFVNLGNGNNVLTVLNSNGGITADLVNIKTGSGADYLAILQLHVLDDFFADLGEGNDSVYINQMTASNRVSTSGDEGINVYTRGGADIVQIYNSWSAVDVVVILDSSLTGAPGFNDRLYMTSVTAQDDFWLYGFGGSDQMYLSNLRAGDVLFADLGAGDDFLKLTNSRARMFSTHAGSGVDTLQYYNDSYSTWSYTGWEKYVNAQ
jgi:hypothetical protein